MAYKYQCCADPQIRGGKCETCDTWINDESLPMVLTCDGKRDCKNPVTHVDNKGWLYCACHGLQRKCYVPCRQLKSAEIKRLQRGETISYRVKPPMY